MPIHDEFVSLLSGLPPAELEILGRDLNSGNASLVSSFFSRFSLTNYSIECISRGNSKIYKVTKAGESEPFILKMEAWTMPVEVKHHFETVPQLIASVAPIYFEHPVIIDAVDSHADSLHNKKIQIQPFCKGGTLESAALRARSMSDDEKIDHAFRLYDQVADFYMALERSNILFPDGKPSNFTLDKDERLQLTDMKTYQEASEDSLKYSYTINSPNYPLYIPIPPPRELEKVHVRHFAMNLYGYLRGYKWRNYYNKEKYAKKIYEPIPDIEYDFLCPPFDSPVGKILADLIKKMMAITDDPELRKLQSVAFAQRALREIYKDKIPIYKSAVEEMLQELEILSLPQSGDSKLNKFISEARVKLQDPSIDIDKLKELIENSKEKFKEFYKLESQKSIEQLEVIKKTDIFADDLGVYIDKCRLKIHGTDITIVKLKELYEDLNEVVKSYRISVNSLILNNLQLLETVIPTSTVGVELKTYIDAIRRELQDQSISFDKLKLIYEGSIDKLKHYYLIEVQKSLGQLESFSILLPSDAALIKYIEETQRILQKPGNTTDYLKQLLKQTNEHVSNFYKYYFENIIDELSDIRKFNPRNKIIEKFVASIKVQLRYGNSERLDFKTFFESAIEEICKQLEIIYTPPSGDNKLSEFVSATRLKLQDHRLGIDELKILFENSNKKLKKYYKFEVKRTIEQLETIYQTRFFSSKLKDYIHKCQSKLENSNITTGKLKELDEGLKDSVIACHKSIKDSVENNLKQIVETIIHSSPDDGELMTYIEESRGRLNDPSIFIEELSNLYKSSIIKLKDYYKSLVEKNLSKLESSDLSHDTFEIEDIRERLKSRKITLDELKILLEETNEDVIFSYKGNIRLILDELEEISKFNPLDTKLKEYVLSIREKLYHGNPESEELEKILEYANIILTNLNSDEYNFIISETDKLRKQAEEFALNPDYVELEPLISGIMTAKISVIENYIYSLPLVERGKVLTNFEVKPAPVFRGELFDSQHLGEVSATKLLQEYKKDYLALKASDLDNLGSNTPKV